MYCVVCSGQEMEKNTKHDFLMFPLTFFKRCPLGYLNQFCKVAKYNWIIFSRKYFITLPVSFLPWPIPGCLLATSSI